MRVFRATAERERAGQAALQGAGSEHPTRWRQTSHSSLWQRRVGAPTPAAPAARRGLQHRSHGTAGPDAPDRRKAHLSSPRRDEPRNPGPRRPPRQGSDWRRAPVEGGCPGSPLPRLHTRDGGSVATAGRMRSRRPTQLPPTQTPAMFPASPPPQAPGGGW